MRRFALAVLLAASAVAQGQGMVGLGLDYPMTTAPMINYSMMSMMNNNAMNTAAHGNRGKSPATRQTEGRADAPSNVEKNAQELAQAFPAAHRGQMAQVFQQSMDVYQQIEAKMGFPRNDIGGAMAAFIVGNYMVYKRSEVSDAEFEAVARQMRNAIGSHDRYEMRKLFEQSAMVGAFMALAHKSLQQKPQPQQEANLRQSAHDNLKAALGTDPARLRISARGLSVE